ncbi:glycosyltransferase family 4 protein [Oceanicella actignis]|uniref:Glycosyltransferase involved in cell wall bisynthesis n=1 Tax=Oceanicella actignis TaxID=1189325 RepID=A0A1M7TNV4_9RHOB|nr:glycosyltransferase family 4 protein [Oceanicella actignis]TYO85214.1 glycosyltransferase involved in cell wall biosynthesis [Oceanicella actignis]SET72761.1 Glycosyltransferase involved in cell wall bisynthesis [Oceanicella actignis]SHN72313.1 Glycosyltransferase involved in cell wall bisynthesis [Oceanicella actignis]
MTDRAENAPPTVLQVIPAMKSGGAELGALQVAEALTRAGGRAFVMSEGGRMVAALERAGATHVTAPVATKNPARILANALRIARFCRANGVQVIHARSRAPAWSCLLAARLTGCAFVATYHSGYRAQNRLKNFYNGVMARADRVIAVSEWIAEDIRRHHAPPEGRIVVIHRAVDPERFDPARIDPAARARLRESWGVGPGTMAILLAGRISRRKGQHLMVEAAARLRRDPGAPPFAMIFAGDDQGKTAYRDEVAARIRALGLEDAVRFVGHLEDMPLAYAAADISVSAATAPEGYQRAMLESQAMGVPVAVSDIGPGVEVVRAPPRWPEDQATGLNFRGNDVEDLTRALLELMTMPPERRAAMGARASAWVRSEHTVGRLTAQTLEVYRQVLAERGRR